MIQTNPFESSMNVEKSSDIFQSVIEDVVSKSESEKKDGD